MIRSIRTSIALYTAICIILVGGGTMYYANNQLERSLSQSYQVKFENATSLIAGSLTDAIYQLDVRRLNGKLKDAKVINPAIIDAFATNANGSVLADAMSENRHRDASVKEVFGRDIPESGQITSRFVGNTLETSVAINDPQDELLGYLLIDYSLKDDLAYLNDVKRSSLRLMAFLVAAGMVLGYLSASRFTRPIHQIADFANEIRERNFDARVRLERADELGLLATTMNTMAEELQRNDDYVSSIFRSIKHSLIVVGPEGTVETANPAIGEITGWSMNALTGEPLENIIDFSKTGDAQSDDFCPGASGDAILKTSRGSEIPVYVTSATIPASRDEPKRVVYVATDISERVELEKFLREAKEAAEESNQAKSRFLANMSHEIRTPLNGIVGFTDLMRGCDDENKRCEYLQVIRSSVQHLLTLINEILDLSKIEADQLKLELTRFSPHEIFRDVTSVLRVKAAEKGLKLEYSWDGPVPSTIVSDSARLRQLLMNLVANAIKFTEEGSVSVVARCDPQRCQLLAEVQDTGIGIARDNFDSIFNPFVQADSSFTRRFGGTGLGLAISRRIAYAMGGELTVDSDLGKGSLFSFNIDTGPLDDVEMLDRPSTVSLSDSDENEFATLPPSMPPANILLVEDISMNRDLLRIIMEEAGLNVTTAKNGQIGCQLADERVFDVILMDMQMPVMDGYTATRHLRNTGVTVPIIALTAHAMRGDEEKCQSAGCSHYLAKPITPDRLLLCLASVLNPVNDNVDRRAADPKLELNDSSPNDSSPNDSSPNDSSPNDSRLNDSEMDDPEDDVISSLPLAGTVYQTVIREFGDFLDEHLAQMQEAFDARAFSELSELAHGLKGAGGMAGFDILTDSSRRLEFQAAAQDETASRETLGEISDLAARIARTLHRARATEIDS